MYHFQASALRPVAIISRFCAFTLILSLSLGSNLVPLAQAATGPDAPAANTQVAGLYTPPAANSFSPPSYGYNAPNVNGTVPMLGSCLTGIVGGAALGMMSSVARYSMRDPKTRGTPTVNMNPTGACPTPGGTPRAPSCEEITNRGKIDDAAIDALIGKAEGTKEAYLCQVSVMDGVAAQMACLQQQSSMIESYANSVQQAISLAEQQANAITQPVIQQIGHLDAQAKQAQSKLGGDKDSGENGLLELKQKAQQVISAMPGEVTSIERGFDNIKTQKKQIDDYKTALISSESSACLKEPMPGFKCEQDGPNVGLEAYMACVCAGNELLDRAGRVETSGTAENQKRAAAAGGNFAALFKQMDSDFPKIDEIRGLDITKGAIPRYSIRSALGFSQLYRSKFDALKCKARGLPPGKSVGTWVTELQSNCWNKASRRVKAEEDDANSRIAQFREGVKNAEAGMRTQADTLLDKYDQTLRDVKTGLANTSMPFTTLTDLGIPGGSLQGCKGDNAKPEIQNACLRSMRVGLEGVMSGRAAHSATAIDLPGSGGQAERVACYGLDGCIKELQKKMTEKKSAKGAMEGQLKQAKAYIKQETNKIVATQRSKVAAMTADLKSKISQLTKDLGPMGVKITPPKFDQAASEDLEFDDETGVPKPPKDITALLGLAKLEDGAVEGMSGDIAEAKKDKEEKIALADQATDKIQGVAAKCKEELYAKNVEKSNAEIDKLWEKFNSRNCAYAKDVCDGEKQDKLGQLSKSFKDLQLNADEQAADSIAGLSGIPSGLCGDEEERESIKSGQEAFDSAVKSKAQARPLLTSARNELTKATRAREAAGVKLNAAKNDAEKANLQIAFDSALEAEERKQTALSGLEEQISQAEGEIESNRSIGQIRVKNSECLAINENIRSKLSQRLEFEKRSAKSFSPGDGAAGSGR